MSSITCDKIVYVSIPPKEFTTLFAICNYTLLHSVYLYNQGLQSTQSHSQK